LSGYDEAVTDRQKNVEGVVQLRRFPCALCVALAIVLCVGCSDLKTYPNTLEKNLRIQTVTRSGSVFSNVRARVDIYRVGPACRLDYEGTVDLDEPVRAVGIPTNRPSYLVFTFASSTFLGGTNSATSQETLLEPRPGYRYDIDASYEDNIYNVVVRERSPRRTAARELALTDLRACKKP
jgi:hypothetical protein